MYDNYNLAIGKVASKSNIKPALNAVAFYGDKSVATDGFRLLEVSADGEHHDPIVVPLSYVNRIKLTKDVTVSEDELKANAISEKYPDYEPLMERHKDDQTITIRLNGKLLGELLTIMSRTAAFERIEMNVSTTDPTKGIILTSDGKKRCRAILMPMTK